MLIDEKGRLFSKFSIIDVAIVLMLIVSLVFVGFKVIGIGNAKDKVEGETVQNYEITFKINGVRQATVDALSKSVGSEVCDAWSVEIGKLSKIESVEPLMHNVANDDGSFTQVEVPEKYVIKMVVDVEAIKTIDSIMLENKRKFSVGSTMTLNTKEIAVETAVTKITKK